jgi:hypothetical protein
VQKNEGYRQQGLVPYSQLSALLSREKFYQENFYQGVLDLALNENQADLLEELRRALPEFFRGIYTQGGVNILDFFMSFYV